MTSIRCASVAALALVLVPTARVGSAVAAEESAMITVDELLAPASPASSVLGASPSAIERPSDAKSFVVAVASTVSDSDLEPGDYAFEATPYWFSDHPGLSFDEYYHPSALASLVQSFGLSAAVSKTGASMDVAATARTALGFRTQLAGGGVSDTLRVLRDRILDLQRDILDVHIIEGGDTIRSIDIEFELDQIEDGLRLSPSDSLLLEKQKWESYRTKIQAKEDAIGGEIKRVVAEIPVEGRRRVGFCAELSGAGAWEFPGNEWERGTFSQGSAWVTVSYTSRNTKVQVLGIGRYIREETGDSPEDLFDFGGRALLRFGRLNLSGEMLDRVGYGEEAMGGGGLRAAVIVEYRVASNMYLIGTYGKDFEVPVQETSGLLATLGLNWGLGTKPVVGVN